MNKKQLRNSNEKNSEGGQHLNFHSRNHSNNNVVSQLKSHQLNGISSATTNVNSFQILKDLPSDPSQKRLL